LFAPALVIGLLTVLDNPVAASSITPDNPFWRPLGLSFFVVLFVTVSSLERNPFLKPLHMLIIGAKVLSSAVYLFYAASLGAVSMVIAGLIDGVIAFAHVLFYYRLSRVGDMAGAEFRWSPYYLLFTERFIADFADSMAPDLEEPIRMDEVVANVIDHVRRFPIHVRYTFVFFCYYIMLVLPCVLGFPPYFLMNRDGRRQFLKRVQHGRRIWVRAPLLFVKMVCSMYVYGQQPYLRAVGVVR